MALVRLNMFTSTFIEVMAMVIGKVFLVLWGNFELCASTLLGARKKGLLSIKDRSLYINIYPLFSKCKNLGKVSAAAKTH